MLATIGTKPALHQRAKMMIVAALLGLSMIAGFTGTTTQVDAAKREPYFYCAPMTQEWWIAEYGWDPGPNGGWECDDI